MESVKKAILLSGGMDSICLAYHLKPELAYTINYGQLPAKREIEVSRKLCEILNIKHEIIKVDCSSLGSGSLINKTSLDMSPSEEWWPYRNQLLITLSLMKAIADNVCELHLATVKSDSFHKDGTVRFYELINNLSTYQEGKIKIICITNNYYTHELVKLYNIPVDLLLLSHSCHNSNVACGICSGCLKNIRVKQELGIE